MPALILTLQLEQAAFLRFDALRRAHFPPERNLIPAHLTLFHALPGEQELAIRQELSVICARTTPLDLHFPGVRFLGAGVAIEVEAPELLALRRQLASRWHEWLSAQDRQGYRPHITIQNKVLAAQARELYTQLLASWEPLRAAGTGLLLWRYLGGPWELLVECQFAGPQN